jgi:hypothetical protein
MAIVPNGAVGQCSLKFKTCCPQHHAAWLTLPSSTNNCNHQPKNKSGCSFQALSEKMIQKVLLL